MFIDGQWVDAASGQTFETPNPATGETLANVAEGDAEDINRAVRAARRAFEDGPWSRMTPSDRGRLIWKIGDLILEHADELAQLESLDNGKPVGVARAADVPLAADLFHYMAGWATKIEGNTINISVPYMPGANFHAYTLREPVATSQVYRSQAMIENSEHQAKSWWCAFRSETMFFQTKWRTGAFENCFSPPPHRWRQ
ncbi:MAG: aldehyde dehydrogenase family protein, partial [Sciscionella sp.]